MITSPSDYKAVPDFLSAFAKQFKTDHFHIHGGYHKNSAEDTLLSVFKDQTNRIHQGVRKALQWGLFGLVTGGFYQHGFGGSEKQFMHTRTVLGKFAGSYKYPGYFAAGALYGLAWWVIKDLCLCPHGRQSSTNRYVWAHALQGALVVGTLYHPSAIGYGLIIGAIAGGFSDHLSTPKLPKNFMLYMPNFDQEKRRKKLLDDQQYQLSLRNVLHTNRVFHPI